jgi:hypothetical protein
MMKKQYIYSYNSSLVVLFPKYLTRNATEELLKQGYSKTLNKKNNLEITFSFKLLEWANIYELSIISLWISKVFEYNKTISFIYPDNTRLFGFLNNFRFISFIRSFESKKDHFQEGGFESISNTIFYPMTFLNYKQFEILLEDLNYKDRLRQVFREVADIEIIKSGKLRDNILFELGENMFLHGDGKNASIIATGINEIDSSKIEDRIRLVSTFEKDFFKVLGKEAYIEIVMSDNGKGIFKSLSQAYELDLEYPKRKEKPNYADLLEYAFLPYTSSRDLKSRLNFIQDALDDDTIQNPPVTGLNKLKSIIKEFRGLLMVRSGKGIICYDYLSNAEQIFPQTNYEKKHKFFKDICNFGGVQYKILIPVKKPLSLTPIQDKIDLHETKEKIVYEYKRLDNYFTAESKFKVDVAKNQYFDFEKAIENFHIKNNEIRVILIFDLCEALNVNQKLLHLIILKLMSCQSSKQLTTFINLPSEYISLLRIYSTNSKAIIGFDVNLNMVIFGINSDDYPVFNRIISGRDIQINETKEFIERYPYLFELSTKSFYQNRNQIHIFSNIKIRERIKDFILKPESGVFFKEEKVLIPTNLYCQGYFEIKNLFKNVFYRSLVKEWLSIGVHMLKPNLIISLSEHCGEIISELSINQFKSLESIVLKTPVKESSFLKLRFKLNKTHRILIFTDVISSAKTIRRLLSTVESFEVLNIVTIVNATSFTEFEINNKKIPISQVLHNPIQYYDSLPHNWLYSELHLTDPETNLLIKQDEIKSEGNLLNQYSISTSVSNDLEFHINNFIDKIIIPNNLIQEGHFISNNKHFTYLFDIKGLVDKYEGLIIDSITKHFFSEVKKRKIKQQLDNYILYFSYNPGIAKLCNVLTKQLLRTELIEINLKTNKNPLIREIKDENVIIIDDAFISGESVFGLLDYCELRGAKNVFIYILIKRGTPWSARKLEKVKKYGHTNVSVRYLFDVELPSYTIIDCPICKESVFEVTLKEFIKPTYKKFWTYIGNRNYNREKRVVTENLILTPNLYNSKTIIYRWKLEISKQDLITQKEIIHYFNNYSQNQEIVKTLIQIFAFEKEGLLSSEIYSSSIYWDELRNCLVNTCRLILFEHRNLKILEYKNILSILFRLDLEFIIDNFSKILIGTNCDEDSVYELLYAISENKSRCLIYYNKIISIFKKFIESEKNLKEEFKETIATFIDTWEKQFNESFSYSDEKRKAIRELFLESYHEFPRTFDALMNTLTVEKKINKTTLVYWNLLRNIIIKSIKYLRLLSETGINNEDIILLDNTAIELSKLVSQVDYLFNSEFNNEIIEFLNKVSGLIIGEKGMINLLLTFKVDLKKLLAYLINKHNNQFIKKKITAYYEIPDYSCLVFGDEPNVLSSLDNLLENVHEHSEASKFVLCVKKTDDEQNICIEFFDNGNKAKLDKGIGLKNVTQNINKYLGEFTITNNYKDDTFKTYAIIKLINLSKM